MVPSKWPKMAILADFGRDHGRTMCSFSGDSGKMGILQFCKIFSSRAKKCLVCAGFSRFARLISPFSRFFIAFSRFS